MSSKRITAADGEPFPLPRILVSRREQRPYVFGWKPVMQPETGARVALHLGVPLAASLIVRELGGPFPCSWTREDAPLLTADYSLEHPEHGQAMEEVVLIETKRRDLAASLTHGHDNLLEEMARMERAKFRYLICANDGDALMEGRCGCGSRVKSMVHCLESIAMLHGVQVRQYKNESRAEYIVALVLDRAWCGFLAGNAEALRCARAREEAERVSHEPPLSSPVVALPWATLGMGEQRRRKRA